MITTIRRDVDRFGHVQIVGAPGRHEPGTGELAVTRVLSGPDELRSALSGPGGGT